MDPTVKKVDTEPAQYIPANYERSQTLYESVALTRADLQLLPEDFRRLVDVLPPGAVIAGGAIMDAMKNLPIKDVDVFFTENDARQVMQKTLKDLGYRDCLTSSPPGCQDFTREGRPAVQLINIRDYDEVADILDGFDFTVCQLAVTGGQHLYYGPTTICDIVEGVINIHRLEENYPDIVEKRVRRYLEKGYRLSTATRKTIATIGVEV